MNHFLAMAATTMGLVLALPAAAESLLSIQMNNATIVEIPGEAKTMFVSNPAVADVTPIASNKLFILGRAPGQSNLIILDDAGNEILNGSLIVTPQSSGAMTVHRGVRESSYICTPRCIVVDRSISQSAAAGNPATAPGSGAMTSTPGAGAGMAAGAAAAQGSPTAGVTAGATPPAATAATPADATATNQQ